MYKLVIQDDEGKTTVVPLIRDELSIGRKEGNTIRLTERNVSRRHAKVYRQNGSISIEDLDSYNGIRVNGSRIQGRVDVKESDRIQIGDYLIEIKSEAGDKRRSEEQQTQPIERVDPMATTPIPAEAADAAPTVPTPMVSAEGSNPAVPVATTAEPTVPLADTDPAASAVRAPVAPAPAPAPGMQPNPRLVVLSTNFAGQEFELDKPAMVIGRTDENDVWINHRSISRHHAKIVRENGRHAIVDLQSSNGVRVNGEEYGKVELRRADVIDLGHVRLRFVEAGEDFVFGRDAQAVDLGGSGGGRSAFWAILVLVLLGGVIGGFALMRDGGGASADESADSGKDTQTQVATNPVEKADAATEAIDPQQGEESDEVRELNDRAQEAVRNEDWHDAIQQAEAALAKDPGNQRAQQIKKQAEAELGAQALYKELVACRNDAVCVIDHFNQLEDDSVYRVKARDRFERAKNNYKAFVLKAARRATSGNNRQACLARLDRLAREAGAKLPELSAVIRAQAKNCPKEAVVDNKPDHNTGGSGGNTGNGGNNGNNANGNNGGNSGGNAGPSAAVLVDQAQAAAKASQFGKALRLCQAALQKKRGDQRAALVCAIAACNLKSQPQARRYIRKLRSVNQRNMARQICLRQGVTIDN